MTNCKFTFSSALILILCGLCQAQTAASEDTETQRLKAELARLQQQTLIAKEYKSLAEASLPKFTGGVDGSVTFSGDIPGPAVNKAYMALSEVANEMAKKIKCDSGDRLMISSATEISAFDTLHAFRMQSRLLRDQLEKAITLDKGFGQPAGLESMFLAGAALVGPLIQSSIDFIKLFRTNLEINSKDVTIDDKAFLAVLATALMTKNKDCRIYHPEMAPVRVLEGLPPLVSDEIKDPKSPGEWLSVIIEKHQKVMEALVARTKKSEDAKASLAAAQGEREARRTLEKEILDISLKMNLLSLSQQQELRLLKLEKEKALVGYRSEKDLNGVIADSTSKRNALAPLLAILTAAAEAGKSYKEEMLKSTTGATLLSRLHRTQRLETVLTKDCAGDCKPTLLFASVQKLTAATIKKTGVFTGTKYSYSGAAIASFFQFGLGYPNGAAADRSKAENADGRLIGSGIFSKCLGNLRDCVDKDDKSQEVMLK